MGDGQRLCQGQAEVRSMLRIDWACAYLGGSVLSTSGKIRQQRTLYAQEPERRLFSFLLVLTEIC